MSSFEAVAPGVRRVALRTPTLPPATHTNCYVVGTSRLSVFDPASPWDDQQRVLHGLLDADPGVVERIVLTHHHVDHVSGAIALQAHLRERGHAVPVVAHPITAELLEGEIPIDVLVVDGDVLQADGTSLTCLHTPGHAPGHLVFHDEAHGTMIAGDMVAGVGTILIDPVEGDLGDYLASLVRMSKLDPAVLLPSHGPALHEAKAVLGFYVAHRHHRTDQIRAALDRVGEAEPQQLAPLVYPELPAEAWPVAAVQILAHLRWMEGQGMASSTQGRWRPQRP